MSQRIDLYRDDLRPREPSGEFQRNVALLGLALVAMLGWGALAQWRASSSASELEALRGEQASLQTAMTAASEQLAQRKPDAALTTALVQAQFGVDGRRWLVEQLQRAGDEVVAFSAVLEGLGRRRPEVLWLTRIRVAAAGAALGLSGRTLDAEAVPGYLERLGAENALQGREFNHFRIERPAEPGEPLLFDMATDCVALVGGCASAASEGGAP